ncbi:hypothetical protein TMatcc_009423 [Talaromyces marneffei ATCC 18224]
MRVLFIILPSISSLCSLAFALGRINLHNNCTFPIYVGTDASVAQSVMVLPDTSYTENIHNRRPVVNWELTLSPPGLSQGAPRTLFSYQLAADGVHYSLHDIFGDPFESYPILVFPIYRGGPACQVIRWSDGLPSGRTPVRICAGTASYHISICSHI